MCRETPKVGAKCVLFCMLGSVRGVLSNGYFYRNLLALVDPWLWWVKLKLVCRADS